jgi:hypothetical protein
MLKKNFAICQSCSKKTEYSECFENCAPPGDARCNALKGWLTVSRWRGVGSVDKYDFCSFSCLQKWVEAQVPKIPKPFLKAFQDN